MSEIMIGFNRAIPSLQTLGELVGYMVVSLALGLCVFGIVLLIFHKFILKRGK